MNISRTTDLARRLILLRSLERKVTELKATLADELRHAGLEPGTTLRPPLADGDERRAGAVSFTAPQAKAAVTDEKAFASWVQEHYPANVELEVVVRPAFTKAVLDMSSTAGQPVGPNGEAGPDSPRGVMVAIGAPVLRALPDKDMAAELWAAIRTDPAALLQLPPAEPEPESDKAGEL